MFSRQFGREADKLKSKIVKYHVTLDHNTGLAFLASPEPAPTSTSGPIHVISSIH